jgi:hypothetical protein
MGNGMNGKAYNSKDDLYKHYPIALKFVLERRVHTEDYKNVYAALATECQAKIDEFSSGVKSFRKDYPLSAGFYVEIPVMGATGQSMDVSKFVLLVQETGWELWPLFACVTGGGVANITLGTVAAYLALKGGEKVIDGTLEESIKKIYEFMKEKWADAIHGGIRINHIEIRTEKKGTAKIDFSKFTIDSLECLMVRWDSISNIMECNDPCFFGNLYQ